MFHKEKHPLAGKNVWIKEHVKHPQVLNFGGSIFIIEDWADRLFNPQSWMFMEGNPACMVYAMRIGFAVPRVPTDNEVVYGHLNGLGHLLHVSEFQEIELKANNENSTTIKK